MTTDNQTDRLENVEIDYQNDRIVIEGVAIEIRDSDGDPMGIDEVAAQDGYVSFLEMATPTAVRPRGDEATVCFVDTDSDGTTENEVLTDE